MQDITQVVVPSVTVCLLVAAFLLLCWYITRKRNFWKSRGVPYVSLSQSNWDMMRMDLRDFVVKKYLEKGPIHGFFMGPFPAISVSDPDVIRDMIVKDYKCFMDNGKDEPAFSFSTNDKVLDRSLQFLSSDDWKRVRAILARALSTGKVNRVFGVFKDCSTSLVENIKKSTNDNKPIDVQKLFGAFTLDVIARSAFSVKIDSHNDADNEFARRARNSFSPSLKKRFLFAFIFPRLSKLLNFSIMPRSDIDFFKKVINDVIEHRRKTGEECNDFVQLMLDSRDELAEDSNLEQKVEDTEEDVTYNNENESVRYDQSPKPGSGTLRGLSMDELVAQCVNFFLSGYVTTYSALTTSTFLLATNQKEQEILRKEIDEAVKETGGEITYESLKNMKYLDNVISEALRLYPPAAGLQRFTCVDYKLSNTDITVPRGFFVQIPTYPMHRDPKYFPDPEKFDPNRFTPEERSRRHPYAYLPFGAGPRNCVAIPFSLMEMKVCLAHLVRHFVIKESPMTKVPIEFYLGMGLLQPKETFLTMDLREKADASSSSPVEAFTE